MVDEKNNRTWKRPESVPFPSVWSKFDGRKEIDGKIPKFWIQDIPEDQWSIVVNYMADEFLNDEPMCKYSGLSNELDSFQDFYNAWKQILQDKLGLICYMENPDPNGKPIIAAMNCTFIVCKSDPPPGPYKGKLFQQILDTIDVLHHMKDPFESLQVDKYLYAYGLYVLPAFRGQGLGLELLKAREPLCRAVGLEASVTVFTATASQILASRAGFKDLTVMSYADLEAQNPSMRYPGIEKQSKYLKYMYIKYQ